MSQNNSGTTTIVILDAHTANPGDLSWDALAELGELSIYERSSAEDVVGRCEGADIVLTNKSPLPAKVIGALPQLRYIGVMATGTNVVDLEAARARDIPVTNVPAYSTSSVAQMVFAHILRHTNRVAAHDAAVQGGAWASCPDFSFSLVPLQELHGQTLGVLGMGRIGRAVADIGKAFGMRVLGTSRSNPETPIDTLFSESDVLTLHCPLTEDTRHIVNARTLSLMKPNALLINTGRGPLVDETALADALNQGRIAGAGLDVLSSEPPSPDHPLFAAKNCVITPHNAWATHAARSRLLSTVVENVRAFLAGTPVNVVNEGRP